MLRFGFSSRSGSSSDEESIEVASIPADGFYVSRIGHPGDGVNRRNPWITSSESSSPGSGAGGGLDRFDLVHLQVGLSGITPEFAELAGSILADRRKPLVVTDHRPSFEVGNHSNESIEDKLLGSADEVIVTSRTMQNRVLDVAGKLAHYLPHPHVLPLKEIRAVGARRSMPPFCLGMPLISMRSDATTECVLESIAERARESSWFKARVDVELEVWNSNGDQRGLAPLLKGLERRGLINVCVHDEWSEQSLAESARAVDIAVLPSACGAHAAFAEAFRDCAVAVVTPDSGYDEEPESGFTFPRFPTGAVDRDRLRQAIENAATALTEHRVPAPQAEDRMRDRRVIAERHRKIYRDLLVRCGKIAPPPSGYELTG